MSRALAVLAVAVLAVAAAASAQGTDCSALDRDYCMIHEADCYYDEETHTCGKMTCTIYQDYAMCMADRQHFGPCEFNWETNTCHEKGIPVTCSAFDHCFDGRCECPTDRCDYHQNQGLCLEKGMDVPCEFFVGDECPTDRCTNDEMGCQSTLEAKACSDINDEADCKKKKGCDFVASLNICWPSDLQDSIPCSMYMDGSSCPTDRCIAVETYPGVSFCLLKDRTPVCEMYGSQEYCVTPCEWNKEIMSCTDPAIGVQCNLFSGTGQCPPDKCKAVNDQCFYPNEPIDCSSFDIYNPGSCDKSAGCYADCDKMLCMACPSTGPCPVNNCTGTDPGFVCDQYTDQSSCDGDASCKWDPNGVCIPAGAPEPCGEFSTESDCENAGFCNWDGSVCVECTGPNCTPIGPTVSPDTGKACNTYNDESCPYPRCFFEFGPDGDGACRAATCYDLHEEDFCSKNKTCTWDADIQACYIKADGVPCNDIYDQTLCTQENDCAWDKEEMRCAGKDTGKECATYSFEECPERCELDYDSSKCTDKACAMFWEEASCKAQKRCTWEADLNVCYSDPTPSKACDAFASYEQCPPNRCIWVFEDGKEECHSMPCSQWYDEDKCKAHDCTWGNFQCYSDPNPNKPCSSFEDVECPMNRCVLDFEAATTKCVDKSCNDFYEEADCKAHDCTWDANRYDCYKDTDPSKSCDKFDAQRTCPTNRCVWDYDTMICRTISCQDIYDPESCTASPKGCAWSDQYGVCYIKGEQIPCSTFNYNQEECPKDHCSWFDSGSAQLCYPTGGSVPCSDIYDEDTCGKAPKKACAWNSDEARCTDA